MCEKKQHCYLEEVDTLDDVDMDDDVDTELEVETLKKKNRFPLYGKQKREFFFSVVTIITPGKVYFQHRYRSRKTINDAYIIALMKTPRIRTELHLNFSRNHKLSKKSSSIVKIS